MNKNRLIFLLGSFFFTFSFFLKANPPIALGKKHIIIFASDNKKIYGTSYFGVFNSHTKPQVLEFPVFLPKNVLSFEPREGLLKEDFFFGENDQLFAKREFQPGLSLIGLDFKMDYSYGNREPLEFILPFDLEELSLAVLTKSGLSLVSEDFFDGVPDMLSQEEYTGILRRNLEAGLQFTMDLQGLPESHFWSYMIALVCALILFCLLFFYVLRGMIRTT